MNFFRFYKVSFFFCKKNYILKTISKKNLKKIGYVFFERYFHVKNYSVIF